MVVKSDGETGCRSDGKQLWKEPEDWFLEVDSCDTPGLQGRPLLLQGEKKNWEAECIRRCDDERLRCAPHSSAICTYESDNGDCWYHDLSSIRHAPRYTRDDKIKLFVFGDPLLGQVLLNNTACSLPGVENGGCSPIDGSAAFRRCSLESVSLDAAV
jgi:hypothetical protein